MRKYMIARLLVVFLAVLTVLTSASGQSHRQPTQQLPKAKQTKLELYMTAKQAYNKWKSAPHKAWVIDVRTPEEYIFIGHADMAWNIPFAFQTYQWDVNKQYFAIKPNLYFVSQVKELAKPSDTILVMCRSGGRSAAAVNLLAESGFTNVYNIIDGMEGDKVDDPESIFHGKRMKNGWKNSGLPWTYDLNPEQMRFPKRQ